MISRVEKMNVKLNVKYVYYIDIIFAANVVENKSICIINLQIFYIYLTNLATQNYVLKFYLPQAIILSLH